MPKVPRTPPPDRLDALPPDIHVEPAGVLTAAPGGPRRHTHRCGMMGPELQAGLGTDEHRRFAARLAEPS